MKFKNGVIVALLCMLSTAVFSQKNIKISGGSKTSCFVADQGKLFSMGNNSAFVDPKVIYGFSGNIFIFFFENKEAVSTEPNNT